VRLVIAEEVRTALAEGRGVVALESSIIAQGLPAPQNLEAAFGCERAVRGAGAVPATTAVVEGQVRVGLEQADLETLAREQTDKLSARHLGPAIAQGRTGATTVAATLRIAALAGIRFLATGGVGGVHRDRAEDVSADLEELARSPVAVFCAGPKLVLDVRSTLERLESLSVPVIGYGSDEVPAFFIRRTGCRADARAEGAAEVARILEAAWSTGARGVLVAVPPPEELDGAEEIVRQAVSETPGGGSELTPRLLRRVGELTGGRSVALNVRLAVNNAAAAAESAAAWSQLRA
jgi:pseudouridine-5'-phosphate glycosidase